MADFNSICDQIDQGFKDANQGNSEESFDKLAEIFSSFERSLQNTIKELSREAINKAIKDLEAGVAISQEDLNSIRLWVVGDADYYIKREDDYKDSVSELNRIIDQINQLKGQNVDIENSAKLRAILEDGIRVIPNIAFYLEKKARLQKFETAIPALDDDGRKMLIEVLKDELASQEE